VHCRNACDCVRSLMDPSILVHLGLQATMHGLRHSEAKSANQAILIVPAPDLHTACERRVG